jgi:hypothetical protein
MKLILTNVSSSKKAEEEEHQHQQRKKTEAQTKQIGLDK